MKKPLSTAEAPDAQGAGPLLVLSPHLDDAALSVGALIAAATARPDGPRVDVVTVFSAGAPEGHAARRAEDRRALAALGARVTHMGLRDAPFRGAPFYTSFERIVTGWRPEEDALRRDLERRFAALAAALAPVRVLAPLAVGEHVDHRVVFAAARAAFPPAALAFYEDLPYALVDGAVALRLACLKHHSAAAPLPDARRLIASFCEEGYVQSFLRDPSARARVVARLRAQRRAARADDASASIMPEVVVCAQAHAARMFEAIGAYESQTPALFPPRGDAEPWLRRRLAARDPDARPGALTLRLWRLDG